MCDQYPKENLTGNKKIADSSSGSGKVFIDTSAPSWHLGILKKLKEREV